MRTGEIVASIAVGIPLAIALLCVIAMVFAGSDE